jgi:hypothetical protein
MCEIYETQDKWLVWSQHKNTNGSVINQNRDDVYSGRNYWSVTHQNI